MATRKRRKKPAAAASQAPGEKAYELALVLIDRMTKERDQWISRAEVLAKGLDGARKSIALLETQLAAARSALTLAEEERKAFERERDTLAGRLSAGLNVLEEKQRVEGFQ